MMTSFAFIFGLLPLIFASGIGSVGNRFLATTLVRASTNRMRELV